MTNFSKNRNACLHILSKPYSVKDQIFPKHSEIMGLLLSVKDSRVTYLFQHEDNSYILCFLSSPFFKYRSGKWCCL